MREAVEHLRKAMRHLNKSNKSLYDLPHSEKRTMLSAMLSNAARLIDSARRVLEREEEETCEKS